MISIFDYSTDFRKYLREYFDDKKSELPRYSYGMFAQKLQCDRGFLHGVMHKDKHLSEKLSIKFARLLDLDSRGQVYFFNLVGYTQTDDDETRDYYWNRLIEGGEESMCGWLKDKFGLFWQVVPTELGSWLYHPAPEQAERAMQALFKMKKIDIETLKLAVS